MKAIIPAAGLGTRFLPWTKTCPKEMLPLLDKPVIQWTLEELLKADIRECVIVVSKGKEALVNYFSPDPLLESYLNQNGKLSQLQPLGDLMQKMEITFVYQKGTYGNATPVLSARSYIPSQEPFIVVWGDEFILSDPPWIKQLTDVYKNTGQSVISAIKVEKDLLASKGIGRVENFGKGLFRILELVEKPGADKAPSNLSLTGAYLLTPDFWPYLEKIKPGQGGELWLSEAINLYCRQKTVLAKEIKDAKFIDAGDKKGYYAAWRELLNIN